MTRYEKIISLNNQFVDLIDSGFIPIHLLDWKVYYEAYLQEMENQSKWSSKAKKTDAVETIATNYDISRRSMFYIISFMESA